MLATAEAADLLMPMTLNLMPAIFIVSPTARLFCLA